LCAFLPAGSEVQTVIVDGGNTCIYDMRIEFPDGDTIEDFAVDLYELASYIVSGGSNSDEQDLDELEDDLDSALQELEDALGDDWN